MNFNLTLIIQMLVFAILIWFTMRFAWPNLIGKLEERSRKIAQGLAAAEQGQQSLAQAQTQADAVVREAREHASHILDQAHKQANELLEQARSHAGAEGQRLVAAAQQQIQLEATHARESLRKDIAQLAVSTASKVLEREVDAKTHADLIASLAAQI